MKHQKERKGGAKSSVFIVRRIISTVQGACGDGLGEGWERQDMKVVVEIKLFRAARPRADCEELQ